MAESESDKRVALIEAAKQLFLQNTYSRISIRRIAEKAKVNSALIAYYFGSKNGLFRAMIEQHIQGVLSQIDDMPHPPKQMSLQQIYLYFYHNVPTEFVQLIFRTVILERGETRDWLLEALFKPAFKRADEVITSVLADTTSDYDPLVFRTVFQSLLLAPKLLQPLLSELEPGRIDDHFYEQLAKFNAELLSEYFGLEEKE